MAGAFPCPYLSRLLDGATEQEELFGNGGLPRIRVTDDGKGTAAVDFFLVMLYQGISPGKIYAGPCRFLGTRKAKITSSPFEPAFIITFCTQKGNRKNSGKPRNSAEMRGGPVNSLRQVGQSEDSPYFPRTTNSSRRFFDQAASSWPGSAGRSLP